MARKIYSRNELEEKIALFKPELIAMDESCVLGQRFNKHGDQEFGKTLFSLYRIYACLQDFVNVDYFQRISNNFYTFKPVKNIQNAVA